jgi:hypothetical protein
MPWRAGLGLPLTHTTLTVGTPGPHTTHTHTQLGFTLTTSRRDTLSTYSHQVGGVTHLLPCFLAQPRRLRPLFEIVLVDLHIFFFGSRHIFFAPPAASPWLRSHSSPAFLLLGRWRSTSAIGWSDGVDFPRKWFEFRFRARGGRSWLILLVWLPRRDSD